MCGCRQWGGGVKRQHKRKLNGLSLEPTVSILTPVLAEDMKGKFSIWKSGYFYGL